VIVKENTKTNNYTIKCVQTKTIQEEVNATSKQEAVQIGYDMLNKCRLDFDFVEPEYNVTSPDDIDESVLNERRMNLGSPWKSWVEVYNVLETINDMYPTTASGGNVAEKKIDTFYDIFKGIKVVDQAYTRWKADN
jgi:hypothetical protein